MPQLDPPQVIRKQSQLLQTHPSVGLSGQLPCSWMPPAILQIPIFLSFVGAAWVILTPKSFPHSSVLLKVFVPGTPLLITHPAS